MMKPTTHLFVCGAIPAPATENCHCDSGAALELLQYLRAAISEREMYGVMVTGCECMNLCEDGPVVMVYPEGIWYRQVDKGGAGEILDIVKNTALNKSASGCAGCHR